MTLAMTPHPSPSSGPGPHLHLVGGDSGPTAAGLGESWRPRRHWGRHQWLKAAVGGGSAAVFAAWMVWRWDNAMVRAITGVMTLIVSWMTWTSLWSDLRAGAKRSVTIQGDLMWVRVEGAAGTQPVHLSDVLFVQWRDELEAATGLWFYDRDKKVLTHLNTGWLADPAEARRFLEWARRQSNLPLEGRAGDSSPL